MFPLLGFIINGVNFRKSNALVAGTIGTSMVFGSFICAVLLFLKLYGLTHESHGEAVAISWKFFDWIYVGNLSVDFAFRMDQISALMILIITGVGSLIHLFSVGYMSHDERPFKYFAYLNLFIFNMLLLVLGENLLITFIGWEGVGLCSYLLIGFWFSDPKKAAAGMKAFITNRIGDAGFLVGMFLLYKFLGTLDYAAIASFTADSEIGANLSLGGWTSPATLIALALFVGVTGKSAQVPLYVWLPDAMAGPTPVSALIHAATMVTAGVFVLIKMAGLLLLTPEAMSVIAYIGAITAFMGAFIGLTQWDIKKILAYSTVSQLGYMILAVGVGAFTAAFFHLMTHAFFKALMFLGSGSVIHSMHEEQDIRKMGGLKKAMPITHLTFLIGWLAILGLPPFSGFFSKDEILYNAFTSHHGSTFLWIIGFITAGMTAFYMTRLMALTFWGESRVSKDVHPHESPISMTLPLMVLAVLAAFGGFLGIPHVIGAILPGHPGHWLETWFHTAIPHGEAHEANVLVEWVLMGVSVTLALISAYVAYSIYATKKMSNKLVTDKFPALVSLSSEKLFVDEIYFSKIINPLIEISKGLWVYIDVELIDKFVLKTASFTKKTGHVSKFFQNGNLQNYVLLFSLGAATVMAVSLLM